MTTAEEHLYNLFNRGGGAAGAPSAAAGGRRKGFSNRSWLVVSVTGKSYTEEVGKNSIMRRTGLPARDLRVLDPLLSHPSTILGRERSIVINLEHIKAIITATEVLVPNSKDPIVAPFIHDLQERVSATSCGCDPQQENESFDLDRDARVTSTMVGECNESPLEHHENGSERISPIRSLDVPKHLAPKLLPFEFRALEVCLESACKCLEAETMTLEDEAYPALDELTSKISTLNLERVRQIKSRLVAISGRVQKVRDELEHLLDDDMDMAEMYLTEKLASQSTRETTFIVDLDNEDGDDRNEELDDGSESGSRSSGDFKPNIEELEMLLEAYFVQVDGTLNKLSTLRDYVDDTEDYINIMLDEKQNQLLQMGVSLSTATLVCSAGIVVVSIFGMNIQTGMFDTSTDYTLFWKTTISTVAGCAILYSLAIGWAKRSGLLQ